MTSGQIHDVIRQKLAFFAGGLALLWGLWFPNSLLAGASPAELRQVARILSVRRVPRGPSIPISRYPRIRDFDVYFGLRVSEQTYCADYETVVLDEIDDLMSCNGKEVEVALDEKSKVVVYTPHNRKLKARIVEASNCPSS